MFSRHFFKYHSSPTTGITRLIARSSSTQSAQVRNIWQPFQQERSPVGDYSTDVPAQATRLKKNVSLLKMDKPVQMNDVHKAKKRKIDSKPAPFLPEGSNDEILAIEVADLLAKVPSDASDDRSQNLIDIGKVFEGQAKISKNQKPPLAIQSEFEFDIVALSSTGDGLAYNEAKDHVVVVPFAVPGDRVLAKIYRWAGQYSVADFVKIITPSSRREGVTPKCQYFSQCSGCQFQMLPYEAQLEHKRGIVNHAFKRFSGLLPEQIPEVEPTMGSPLQYEYRTKLTPHFTRPFSRKWKEWDHIPKIGYNIKGRREVMDIESCPIGTDIVQEGLKVEREVVKKTINTFRHGATILLRESTQRKYHSNENTGTNGSSAASIAPATLPSSPIDLELNSSNLSHSSESGQSTIENVYPTHTDTKTYTSNNNTLVTEYVTVTTNTTTSPPTTATYRFTNTAGSFFQNNNSVLGPFTSYIYANCLPSTYPETSGQKPIRYLLDAYSGSGLFTLTLSPLFTSTLGIDIDARAIQAARENAAANNLSNTGFIDADAAALFADVPYPADQTLVVIDPPRKGCDRAFLKQLRRFGPRRVVYVSCNVHTQARDVGVLVNGFREGEWGKEGWTTGEYNSEFEGDSTMKKYVVERVRGFDFFPQTGHVEGVCILNRVD